MLSKLAIPARTKCLGGVNETGCGVATSSFHLKQNVFRASHDLEHTQLTIWLGNYKTCLQNTTIQTLFLTAGLNLQNV
jgi:hypothetical protein